MLRIIGPRNYPIVEVDISTCRSSCCIGKQISKRGVNHRSSSLGNSNIFSCKLSFVFHIVQRNSSCAFCVFGICIAGKRDWAVAYSTKCEIGDCCAISNHSFQRGPFHRIVNGISDGTVFSIVSNFHIICGN